MSARSKVPTAVPAEGWVRSLHRKPETGLEHGLPKPTVPRLQILRGGIDGDFNRYRHEEQHDEPNQAVLLMPIEMLHQLNADGWPIQEGDIGENITTEGIPYNAFSPGGRFTVGEAVLEVSKPCTPCTNLELLPYVGHESGPRFLQTMLGRRGWYASVVTEGWVRTGDPIRRL